MKYKVIVETDVIDRPKDHEIKAALIVANEYFKSDVVFLRQSTYSTPDIEVRGVRWEIKSPLGDGKKTIDNNLRAASKQSANIILDFNRMKMHQTQAISRVNHYLRLGTHGLNRLIIITKKQKILEIL